MSSGNFCIEHACSCLAISLSLSIASLVVCEFGGFENVLACTCIPMLQ